MKRILGAPLFLAALFTIASSASAAPTRVGNGDDGTDLELAKKVESGILIETRTDALARIAKLNAQNVPGLGRLLVELEKSEIFYVAHDVKPTAEADSGGLEHDANVVFARTFPEPVAPTRFFAAALMLEREQLIALHIHEALHRALPSDLRENESTVSQLTLALAAPDSTHDRVQATMAKVLYANRFTAGAMASTAYDAPQSAAPKSSASIREFLGLSDWKVKYKQAEIAARFSNRDAEDSYGTELIADFRFDEIGPLGSTSVRPYLAMASDRFSFDQDGTRSLANGPAGIKISTKIWSDNSGEALLEYRYVTATPADVEVRAGYNARTLKEYGLLYRSTEVSSYRSSYSLSVIEGAGANMASLASYIYPGQIVDVTYGSMLTAKYALDMQLTGDLPLRRGTVLQASAELVEIEPTTTRVALGFGDAETGPLSESATSSRSLLTVLGLGLSWQGEKFRFGLDAKLSSISRGSAALSQTGDFAEHRFDNLYASTTFAYAL